MSINLFLTSRTPDAATFLGGTNHRRSSALRGCFSLYKTLGHERTMCPVCAVGPAVLPHPLSPNDDLGSSQQPSWTVNDFLQMILVPNLKIQFFSLPNWGPRHHRTEKTQISILIMSCLNFFPIKYVNL